MDGDYLFKLEMLRKGIRSNIIWMIIIALIVGGIYLASLYVWSDTYHDDFKRKAIREFDVPLYTCPVEIDMSIISSEEGIPFNATVFLIEESKANFHDEDDYYDHCIDYEENTDEFAFDGELKKGTYHIVILINEVPVNSSQDLSFKGNYDPIKIYLIEPLIIYVIIGGCIIELLLIIFIVRMIIRRKRIREEMVQSKKNKKDKPNRLSSDSRGGGYQRMERDRYYSDDEEYYSEYDVRKPPRDRRTERERFDIRSNRYSNDWEEDVSIEYIPSRSRSGPRYNDDYGDRDFRRDRSSRRNDSRRPPKRNRRHSYSDEDYYEKPPRPTRERRRPEKRQGRKRDRGGGPNWDDDDVLFFDDEDKGRRRRGGSSKDIAWE